MSWPNDILAPDFPIRVAMGKVPGWATTRAFGHLPHVDSATVPEDVWTLGGIYPWLTTTTLVKARSSSPQDAPGGTGCQNIRINSLDEGTYLERAQTITLNGTNDVLVPVGIFRCNGLVGLLPGIANADTTNVGDITLRRQDNDAVIAIIPAGEGMSQQSQWTTPAGKTLIIMGAEAALNALSGPGDRNIDLKTYFRAPGQIFRTPRRITCSNTGPTNLEPRTCIIVPEKNDFQFRCSAVSSASDTAVTGAYEAFLVTN